MIIDQHFSELIEGPDEERGIKSPSMLLSALAVPRQTFDSQDLYPDILDKAAALMRSLIKNHPFHNGNKRTAVIAVILFLEENGFDLRVPDNKLIKLAKDIAEHNLSINRIRRTLEKYTQKTKVPKQESLRYNYGGRVVGWFRSQFRRGRRFLSDFDSP